LTTVLKSSRERPRTPSRVSTLRVKTWIIKSELEKTVRSVSW
jgi:hypothetical protein